MENQLHAPTILLISYHFAPASTVGVHRSLHFARSLHDAGYDVRVVTIPADAVPIPDESLWNIFPFPDRVIGVREEPTLSRIYVSIRRRLAKRGVHQASRSEPQAESQEDGAGIKSQSSPLRLVRRYLATWDEFPDRFRGWYGRALKKALELGRSRKIDAVFASGPPWTGVLVASKVASKLACPLILDFRDPWTLNTGRSDDRYEFEHFNRLAMRLERRAIAGAELVLFNSPEVMKRTRANYSDLDGVEFRTILNGSDATRRHSQSKFPTKPPLRIRHFGSLYMDRTVAPLLSTLQVMTAQGGIGAESISVEQFGRVARRLARRLQAAGTGDHVALDIRPKLPFEEAIAMMMEPAILLVIQPPRFNPQIPTKLYDYLCTGNPVLVLAGEASATWALASQYPRCWRLDYSDSSRNLETLDALVEKWRSGLLRQERTVEDTSAFTKATTGKQFVSLVDAVLRRRPTLSR